MKEKIKKVAVLFLVFLKIGLFTFGGGYAMIPIIQNEVSNKRKWIPAEEVNQIITISESTPGPLAINAATYVGYKVAGFFGSLFATLGLVIPSFVIIFLISLFFDKFLSIKIIANAFKGIKAAVAFLILLGGFTLFKTMKKNLFSKIILILVYTAVIVLSLVFHTSVSSIYFIIGGGLIGLIFTYIFDKKGDKKWTSFYRY